MLYSISEIFYSIQGEGRNTGMAAWFIRLAGCNLKCEWCDTDHKSFSGYAEDLIVNAMNEHKCKNVVITGGEPTCQELLPLLRVLRKAKYYIALETNGTNPLLKYKSLTDWITVSPKSDDVITDCFVSEVKVIWPTLMDINVVENNINAQFYYLQPLDNANSKEKNTEHCLTMIEKHPQWRLSIQVQKILSVK